MVNQLKFSRTQIWTVFLFIASAIYLIYELAFNSRIVDGSTGEFSPERMDALELQGRILSGIGMTLLCLKFLKLDNLKSFFIGAATITLIAFSLMFFGQKILIEHLVDSSSAEDRANAQHIAVLKKGILGQHVVLEDLTIPDEAVGTPAAKTMVSIMGAMMFNSDDFINKLKGNADTIVEDIAKIDARKTWPDAYAAYQDYQREVNQQWSSYAEGVNQYEQEKARIPVKAVEKANEVYTQAGEVFKEKTDQTQDRTVLTRKTLELKRAVNDYFKAKGMAKQYCEGIDLVEQKCQIKIENTYRDIVIAKAGRYVPPDYWCYPEKEEVVTRNVRGRQVSSIERTQDCDSMNREWFESKLLALTNNEADMGKNEKLANAVRERLFKEGIEMPVDWTMDDKQTMIDKFIAKGEEQLDAEYRRQIQEKAGEYIPPTLTQSDFLALSLVQAPIQEKLEWTREKPVPLTLNADEFFEQLHAPRYIEPMQEMKDELLSDSARLADGGMNEEKGKNYYRSIIVPPFAMAFSLFFGLLNLFSFGAVVTGWIFRRKWVAKAIAYGSLGSVFVAYPLTSTSAAVESDAFNYFGDELSKQTSPAVTGLAAWVIDAQPLMYPIGNGLASVAGQSAIEEALLAQHVPASKKSGYDDSSTVSNTTQSSSETPNDGTVGGTVDAESKHKQDETNTAPLNPFGQTSIHPLSESAENYPSHSIALLNSALDKGHSVLVDISPIGSPSNEDWVVYDNKIVKDDVCFVGRRSSASLYELKPSTWRVARHGNCSDYNAQETMPSLPSVLRSIKRHVLQMPVIVQLNESITSEVYCNRYQVLMDDVRRMIGETDVVWSTRSRSVLGCLDEANEPVVFMMPKYSSSTKTLKANDHSRANVDEWQRLKALEGGAQPTLSSLPKSLIKALFEQAPYLSGVIIDDKLATEENIELIQKKEKWLLLISDNEKLVPAQ